MIDCRSFKWMSIRSMSPVWSCCQFTAITSASMQRRRVTLEQRDRFGPIHGLSVVQTIDTRDSKQNKDKSVKFEIVATGRGVVPSLDQLLKGLQDSVPGYKINRDKIETEMIRVVGVESNSRTPVFAATAPTDRTLISNRTKMVYFDCRRLVNG